MERRIIGWWSVCIWWSCRNMRMRITMWKIVKVFKNIYRPSACARMRHWFLLSMNVLGFGLGHLRSLNPGVLSDLCTGGKLCTRTVSGILCGRRWSASFMRSNLRSSLLLFLVGREAPFPTTRDGKEKNVNIHVMGDKHRVKWTYIDQEDRLP